MLHKVVNSNITTTLTLPTITTLILQQLKGFMHLALSIYMA